MTTMNDDEIKSLINRGADRNILVYDANSIQGEPTNRLFTLMEICARRNRYGRPQFILTDDPKVQDKYFVPTQTTSFDLTEYYKSIGGTLAMHNHPSEQDRRIVILICDKDPLIGSY